MQLAGSAEAETHHIGEIAKRDRSGDRENSVLWLSTDPMVSMMLPWRTS